MSTTEKRRALGRGLDALLPGPSPRAEGARSPASGTLFPCPIERIVPQRGQPRQHFDDARIEQLAASIREHGLLEPILVRRLPPGGPAGAVDDAGAASSGREGAAGSPGGGTIAGDRYEIVAGERRWRAAQRAGLHEVLVIVKDVAPRESFELALIENVQREDLNAVELAEALDRLVHEHGYTQEALAERLGKDRTTVANSLRLLKLPPRVRTMVIEGELTEGHARALLGAPDPSAIEALAERAARGRLSVRATERLVRTVKNKGGPGAAGGQAGAAGAQGGKSAAVRDLESRLSRHFGARTEIREGADKKSGELAVHYGSLDELDRILDLIWR